MSDTLGVRHLLVVAAPAIVVTVAAGGGQAAAPAAGCARVTPPRLAARHEPRPTKRLDPRKRYDVTLRTNCGSFTIRLAVRTSPRTTASFVSLVRKRYFDRTIFHRIALRFVIQGGDPTGTGTGSPGYETVDRPPRSTRYTHGLVAMAKTQAEAPGTSGSQFFVVTAADAGLPPEYAVLGRVVAGLAVVDRIGRLGNPTTQRPTRTVEIEKATVTVS